MLATTMRTRKAGGFTLLEVLVVLVLAGILSAVAIPSFVAQRTRSADTSIEADLKKVAASVETWLTDNPGDQDGPAEWDDPIVNYTPRLRTGATHRT